MSAGTPRSAKKIYIIAGEASGDMYGARLIEALKKISQQNISFYGAGGDQMKAAGALDFFDLAHFHVTGLTQAIRKIPQYQKAAKIILKSIEQQNPDVAVLIDNPGFNLYLAKKIQALNIPIVYYISPQIWAWKKNRIFKIRKTVRKMLVVFQFEKALYEEYGVPVAFVGHPLKDMLWQAPCEKPSRWITLMPGSRRNEVNVLLPIMAEAAELIVQKFPDIQFKLIQSPTLPAVFYDKFLKNKKVSIELIDKNPKEVIRQSLLAIVCSGTATLECALLGTPMMITNRAGLLTYLAARALIRIPYLGLPNIVLGKMAMPELLQYNATPEKFAAKAAEIITHPGIREKMIKDLSEISDKLGHGGAAENAAREILKELV